jgi:serine/threonine-protein kinase
MERLEGDTLAHQLRVRRTLPLDEVVRLVTDIAAGISTAAAAGIVHRDLKPQNVLLHRPDGNGAGTWKILDFGVARGIDHGDTLTSGRVVGTPSYMAPEQASGGSVDHRTDLYALAAIAYRALTGHPPFAAGEIAETLYRVVHLAPKRPSELASVSAELDLVLAIGLAKQPAQRFPNAGELVRAITDAAAGAIDPRLRTHAEALVEAGAWARGARPPKKLTPWPHW